MLIKPSYCSYIDTSSHKLFSLSYKNLISSVVRKVYDLPTDFLYLNSCSIEPIPRAAATKNSVDSLEKQIVKTSKF